MKLNDRTPSAQAEVQMAGAPMKILLYCPDNGVTQNFMPHLWMFLLQSLTPARHQVLLIDGNTQPLTDAELVRYVLDNGIGLVGCCRRSGAPDVWPG